MIATTSLGCELLGVTERLWCEDCHMMSGVRATFTVHDEVGHVDLCSRCHGGNITQREAR